MSDTSAQQHGDTIRLVFVNIQSVFIFCHVSHTGSLEMSSFPDPDVPQTRIVAGPKYYVNEWDSLDFQIR